MTDTPETDTPESDKAKIAFTSLFASDDAYWVPFIVARKLERERDEARGQLRKAQVENDHNWQAMNLYEAERVLADRLAALLQRDRDGHGGQVVDPECECCDCKWLKPIDEALAAWKEARSESALP